MDSLIVRFDAAKDGDLMLCEHRGVAYQRDMSKGRIEYDRTYYERYKAYDGSGTERALNAGRLRLLQRHRVPGHSVLDIGVGAGAFMRAAQAAGFDTCGYDINPVALEMLESSGMYSDLFMGFDALTFWDSLEHIDKPERILRRVSRDAVVLVATPIYKNLASVRASKHYKPGEHLYYWTDEGLIDWMALYGFRLLERSTHEVDAGREAIGAYAFKRDLPDYLDYVEAYKEIHRTKHYGDSATELHFNTVAALVRALQPKSILDYGCGRSDLVAHFWLDGKRNIARYDPAIGPYRRMPSGRFDLVFCCDVMEHIPMAYVDRVLDEVKARGSVVFFTISRKLAKARLLDGSNAHVTLLTESEWVRWIGSKFGRTLKISYPAPEQLLLLAGHRQEVERRIVYRENERVA